MSEVSQPPEGASGAGGQGEEGGVQVKERTRETTQQVAERVREGAQQVTEQVQEKAQEVRGQVGGRVREQVDQRSTDAGQQVRSIADAARKTSETLRNEGNERPAAVVEQAAQRIERLGGYLEETNADRLLRDVEDFGRRQPWALAAAGAALGFFAARFLKASSRERYEARGDGQWTAPARPGMQELPRRADGSGEPGFEPTPTGPTGGGSV